MAETYNERLSRYLKREAKKASLDHPITKESFLKGAMIDFGKIVSHITPLKDGDKGVTIDFYSHKECLMHLDTNGSMKLALESSVSSSFKQALKNMRLDVEGIEVSQCGFKVTIPELG